jgi:hypothetical protein
VANEGRIRGRLQRAQTSHSLGSAKTGLCSCFWMFNRRLDSSDEVISLMVKDQTDREYLWTVVSSAADALQSLAGPHHDYVAARLLAIIVSHGLGLVLLWTMVLTEP